MRVPRRRREQDRTGRQLTDLVEVPLQHVGGERDVREQRVALGRVPARDQGRTDLGTGRGGLDGTAVRGGQQLRAEAHRERRYPVPDRLAQQP